MTIQPLGSEVFARIRSDHRNRRGPFRHEVVAGHEIVGHYDIRNIKPTQAKWALRQLSAREAVCGSRPHTIRLFVCHPGPLADGQPLDVHAEYLRARGLSAPPPTR